MMRLSCPPIKLRSGWKSVGEVTRDCRVALDTLRHASRVFITSHTSPDGDAIGSALGFAELAEALGIATAVVFRDPHPSSLNFLPHLERVLVRSELPSDYAEAFDLAVTLECPGLDRPGFDGLLRLPLLNIDHHLKNQNYGAVNVVDEQAPAVGEMVFAMAEMAGVSVTPAMATNLYTALVTDTGDFRYSNATPRAFTAAAKLVAAGANPPAIAEALWEHTPARVIRLTAAALSTLDLLVDGKLAVLTCDSAMLERTGARPEDTESLINIPRAIDGVRIVALIKGFNPESTRVSMRSRDLINIQDVALIFGGGGHRNAAGCTIPAPLPEARRLILDHLIRLAESS